MPPRAYVLGFTLLVVGIFAGFSIASKSIPPAPSPSATNVGTPTETTIPGDGTFLVGTTDHADVRPGIYHSTGNSRPCTWTRAEDASGELRSVIAQNTSRGDAYVELHAGEFFDSSNCLVWERAKIPQGPRTGGVE
jgi:hypothetical protein